MKCLQQMAYGLGHKLTSLLYFGYIAQDEEEIYLRDIYLCILQNNRSTQKTVAAREYQLLARTTIANWRAGASKQRQLLLTYVATISWEWQCPSC